MFLLRFLFRDSRIWTLTVSSQQVVYEVIKEEMQQIGGTDDTDVVECRCEESIETSNSARANSPKPCTTRQSISNLKTTFQKSVRIHVPSHAGS